LHTEPELFFIIFLRNLGSVVHMTTTFEEWMLSFKMRMASGQQESPNQDSHS